MAQRKSIYGSRPSLLWLTIILVLVLIIALATVVFVIAPERQLAVQATATAQAYASEVQRAYGAAVAFAAAGDWDKAVERFAKVVALEPGYKDATARLTEARANAEAARTTATTQAIAMAKQAEATATAEIRSAIESAYQRGLAYFDLKRWEQARAEFEQVIAVDPNYKDVRARLVEVEAKIAEIRALTPTATPTITPGPSPTPLPTATNTPTTPPTNTPTPAPTATPSSTPTNTPTRTPTNTPTPTLTNTPRPTNTPIPIPTPIADTPPGTILEVGQTWRQGGVEVTLRSAFAHTRSATGVTFEMYLTNRKPHDISIRYSVDENFKAVDSLGRRLKLGYFSDPYYHGCDPLTQVVPTGQTANLSCTCCFNAEVEIGDTAITEIIITSSGISSVTDARWRIPIYH